MEAASFLTTRMPIPLPQIWMFVHPVQPARFLGLAAADWIDLLQTVLIAISGFWALYTYRSSRKDQARLSIEHAERLHLDPYTSEPVLLLRLTISNPSGTLVRYRNATVTLLDASERTASGDLRLVPFAEDDPFVSVNATISTDPDEIRDGRAFVLGNDFGVTLEPGEAVNSDLAFILNPDNLGLLAVQVMINGRQGRWRRGDIWWGCFFFVDVASLERPVRRYRLRSLFGS